MPTPVGATCPRHPSALAVDMCERCGRFVCGDCAVLKGEKTWCAECAAVPHTASARATLALVLGLSGFLFCGPLSIAAIAVGLVEQRAIERRETPVEGLTRARWAVRLGVLQIALVMLLVVSFVAWRLLRTP
ncbi:MAG: DUF4190 domain-containing protein [Archangium sp.]|nr:DUF4190 domain-containing protein [Archangium sp.]